MSENIFRVFISSFGLSFL